MILFPTLLENFEIEDIVSITNCQVSRPYPSRSYVHFLTLAFFFVFSPFFGVPFSYLANYSKGASACTVLYRNGRTGTTDTNYEISVSMKWLITVLVLLSATCLLLYPALC